MLSNNCICNQTRKKCWNSGTTFRAEQGPCEPRKGFVSKSGDSETARESQKESERARENQIEPERESERVRKSQREPERVR